MSRFKLAIPVIGAALAAVVVTQHLALRRSRAESAELRQNLAAARESVPPAPSAADAAELERLRAQHEELLRLRGQVAQLRRERDELARKVTSLAASASKPAAVQNAPVDDAWVQQTLAAPVAQQGATAGAVRNKMLNGQPLSAAEKALLDALAKRDMNSLERTPTEFADFQAAMVQNVTGLTDPQKTQQIHDLIRNTYEHAVANRLDIPSKPAEATDDWVNRRHQLDRRATSAIQGMLTPDERRLFDRAFIGIMGVDIGTGVDKSNYPRGFAGPP
jgi:hypothetical protein